MNIPIEHERALIAAPRASRLLMRGINWHLALTFPRLLSHQRIVSDVRALCIPSELHPRPLAGEARIDPPPAPVRINFIAPRRRRVTRVDVSGNASPSSFPGRKKLLERKCRGEGIHVRVIPIPR